MAGKISVKLNSGSTGYYNSGEGVSAATEYQPLVPLCQKLDLPSPEILQIFTLGTKKLKQTLYK